MRRRLVPIVIAALITIMAVSLELGEMPFISRIQNRLENLVYDVAINQSGKSLPSSQTKIVIVDVDEKSISQIGRWPWPRTFMIDLLKRLDEAKAAVIAFDFVFSEPDPSPIDELKALGAKSKSISQHDLDLLDKLRPLVLSDTDFAATLSKSNAVLGMIMRSGNDELSKGTLPVPVAILDTRNNYALQPFEGYLANIEILQNAAAATGFLTDLPDSDGVIRRAQLVLRLGDKLYASMALQAARLYLLYDKIGIEWTQPNNRWQIDALRLGEQRIHTDAQGQFLIPFKGSSHQYLTVSAADLLGGKIDAETFKNALVIIGSSAARFGDLHAVPMQPNFPGVEIQATIADSLIEGRILYSPPWSKGLEIVATLLVGLSLAVALPFMGVAGILGIAASLFVIILSLYYYFLGFHGLVFEVTDILALVVASSIFNLGYSLFIEGGRRRNLKRLFGQYVPKEHVELMSEHPERYTGEGVTANLTVLFADIIGFTSLVEKLDGKETRLILNQFFTPMTRIIFEHKGTVDKYVGDMVMAFWGAPVSDDMHVSHALSAALDMREEAQRLRVDFKTRGLPEIAIGIGLNTGDMLVGDMGSEYRRAFTVLADSVNVASRIEGITRFYGVDIAVGEATMQGQNDFAFRLLDKVRVKGRERPLEIYELICRREELSAEKREEIEAHERALSLYFAQDFAGATTIFTSLCAQYPESKLYKLFLERITHLEKQELPPDWNGAHSWILK